MNLQEPVEYNIYHQKNGQFSFWLSTEFQQVFPKLYLLYKETTTPHKASATSVELVGIKHFFL